MTDAADVIGAAVPSHRIVCSGKVPNQNARGTRTQKVVMSECVIVKTERPQALKYPFIVKTKLITMISRAWVIRKSAPFSMTSGSPENIRMKKAPFVIVKIFTMTAKAAQIAAAMSMHFFARARLPAPMLCAAIAETAPEKAFVGREKKEPTFTTIPDAADAARPRLFTTLVMSTKEMLTRNS